MVGFDEAKLNIFNIISNQCSFKLDHMIEYFIFSVIFDCIIFILFKVLKYFYILKYYLN